MERERAEGRERGREGEERMIEEEGGERGRREELSLIHI